VQDLPYKNDIFTTVFGVDVLHHISDPVKALSEIARVANKNSKFTKCIFIEPYVSVLSYPIFKIFHNENTFLLKNRNMKPPLVGDTPEDADQMIPRRIFQSRRGLSMLEEIYPSKEWNIQIRHIHPFAFFATGGLSNPLHSNAEAIRMLLRLENKIGARVLKYMASRMVVIITKL
jgi:SAM-dependent methyltransferase